MMGFGMTSLPLSALSRIRRRPLNPEDDEEAARIKAAATAPEPVSPSMPVPGYGSARVQPQAAFDQALSVGAPSTADTLRARVTRPAAASSEYGDIPAPPRPPAIQPVQASGEMPRREDYQHGSRWREIGSSVARALAGGGGLIGALTGAATAAISPQGSRDIRYHTDLAKYEASAKPEREAIEAANRGRIQQGQAQNTYYDNLINREKIGDARVARDRSAQDRLTAEQDRQRTINETAEQHRHQQAKDAVSIAAETGTTVNPAAVKGTVFEQYAGQTLTKQQRDHIIKLADEQGQYTYNTDTEQLTQIPGVGGVRVPRDPDFQAPHTILNEGVADKSKFENMKQVELPRARLEVERLKKVVDSLQGSDSGLPTINDPELAAVLAAIPGANRAEKRAGAVAMLDKKKAEADDIQRRMHVHLQDMSTKYSKYPGFWSSGGEGDYPYVTLSPDLLKDGQGPSGTTNKRVKRTGLLDIQ